ncbi:MAG: ATP-binding protein [Actinomycetota bacterium]|nr:ATP-binding protein [Actinomycetota bacterium]
MVISVASGKGGTGKTTIAANLAWAASTLEPVTFLDCDVEEPDSHFYLKPDWLGEEDVFARVPLVDLSCCDGCGKCAEFCRYNALAVIKGDVLVFEELCHSCGGCALACPLGCITYADRRIGIVRDGTRGGIHFYQGLLDIGEPLAVPVLKRVKERHTKDGLTITDCPPGTGCPMIESIKGSDYCILVTEPSPFGRHDLDLAHRVALELGIPHGVLINRSSLSDAVIDDYCEEEGLEILGRIPFSRNLAEACSQGELRTETDKTWSWRFLKILEEVKKLCLLSSPS